MKMKSEAGGILLATLSFIILLAIAAASILELTMNSYKLTMRNEMRAQARAVAESEMESLYFQWVTKIMSAVPAAQTPTSMATVVDVAPFPDTTPGNERDPYLAVHRAQGWKVRRSMWYDSAYDFFDGIIPNTTKRGQVTYVTVRIEVLPNTASFFRNELSVRVGRRFASSNSSIFQYGVFFQGDLELNPGNGLIINGAVAANGSIYIGGQNGAIVELDKKVRYLTGGYFNQDSLGNTVLRKPNTPPGSTLTAPTFGTSQASQVEAMTEPENLSGGVDASAEVNLRPDLFSSENDVYRAAILPPPTASNHDEYPSWDSTKGDDPTINVQRMYTRAGLRVTVNTDNTITVTKADGTDVTSSYAGIVTGPVNKSVYDQRELKNVQITTIDMAALRTTIESTYPSGANDFNGAIYFNLRDSNSTTPKAIRIINGTDIYGRSGNGMSVTTNGALYIQGDYNTATPHLADGSTNPSMLMADAITALSPAWDDANAANTDLTSRVAPGPMTINSGILTGNISATSTNASGGAQNLLRYLENWHDYNVTVTGSLGRLFQSQTFVMPFQQPGRVYRAPANRLFTFDEGLLSHPPAGSPQTTAFSRGSFFVW